MLNKSSIHMAQTYAVLQILKDSLRRLRVFHHRICLETVNLSLYLDARFPGEYESRFTSGLWAL